MMTEAEERLHKLIGEIRPADRAAAEAERAHVDGLAKPPGSLGRLEDIAVKLAGIRGGRPLRIGRTGIIVLCADNGIVRKGVSSAPMYVTAAQAVNMTRGLTGMAALAREFGCETRIVDVGIATPYDCPAVLNRRIRPGTADISEGPAMTREETVQALLTGVKLAEEAHADGLDAIGVGEMGIGNTTTSSAVTAVLTGQPISEVTGRGGGIDDEMLARKRGLIEQAIAVNAPDRADAIDILSKIGGLDLAAMCGVFLGAARYRVPVVIDGFISAAAAALAAELCADVREVLFPSHLSTERGYKLLMERMGLAPYLQLGMRLGEGSGCPLAFQILRAACAMSCSMASFDEARIDDGYLTEIREHPSYME